MIKNCRTPATRRSNRTILAETSAQAKLTVASDPSDWRRPVGSDEPGDAA